MEIKKSDPRIRHFVRHFAGTRSRRPVRFSAQQSYHVSDYWDGGSRTNAVFVNAQTGEYLPDSQVGFEKQTMGNPFNQRIGDVKLTPNVAVVENSIFCGKDMGIRVIMHPDTLKALQENLG